MMTSLYHLATGVLFSWRVGPARQAERKQFRVQIKRLPAGCLIVGDAGFFGFELLQSIVESGRSYLIRGSSTIHLIKHPTRRNVYI